MDAPMASIFTHFCCAFGGYDLNCSSPQILHNFVLCGKRTQPLNTLELQEDINMRGRSAKAQASPIWKFSMFGDLSER